MGRSKREHIPVGRRAHANAYVQFLEGIGVPVERGLEAARLPVEQTHGEAIVTVDAIWTFADLMSRREGIEDLGVEVGLAIQDRALQGSLRDLIVSAPTLLQGLKRFCDHARAEGSHTATGLEERPASARLWHLGPFPGHPGLGQMEPYFVQALVGVVRAYAGPHWRPPVIGLETRRASSRMQECYPQTRILGGQRAHFIEIPRSLLSRPPRRPTANGERAGASVPLLPRGFAEALRRLLESYVSDRNLTLDLAAELAGVSTRTLQRRLQAMGVSFSELLAQTRYQLAARMLADPLLKVIDVAAEAGYDDPAHFSRAFRRMAGVSPRQFRSQATS